MSSLVQIDGVRREPLPPWLRKAKTHHAVLMERKRSLRALALHTVCESARCPNIHECFHRGQATFMILGDRCTRQCGFCAVEKAGPGKPPPPLDPDEPENVARMARAMGLTYVVITSVNRDDLADGGANHFAATIAAVRRQAPEARIEVLTPDFHGDFQAARRVLDAGPDVFNHNVETVPRLYPQVRPEAGYRQSLALLRFAKQHRPGLLTKSGLMVGLGEEPGEVAELLRDLRQIGLVDVVTIGQYLQPTRRHLPVHAYIPPAQYRAWRDYGLAIGFDSVFAGPLVRSSYMADRVSRRAARSGA